jgi:indole-3-acetate monooxygenase
MVPVIKGPAEFISTRDSNKIRRVALGAEQSGMLHSDQLESIYKKKWLNLYVPKEYGGLELSLPEILRMQEGLSYADGSVGWVVTLCSGAAWFIGFLDTQLASELFKNPNVCFAGSGAVTGIANRKGEKYEINGYWKYATGSLYATAFTVNCLVEDEGKPLFNHEGNPLVNSFLLMPNEVTVQKTWKSMGMIATGSHALEVKQMHIPLNRAFSIDPNHTKLGHLIFKFPFLQLAETTLAINLSGMAYRFLDLCKELFFAKENKSDQGLGLLQKLADSQWRFDSFRQTFYARTDEAWENLESEKIIPESVLSEVSKASLALVHRSRELVNELYPYCGLTAADTHQEINRVWRNLHTAGQHSLFNRGFI